MLWLWQRFLGLNAVRLAASIHIVLGHLQKQGALRRSVGGVYVLRWGFTWVPWFFMLSGYVLSYARLTGLRPSSDLRKLKPAAPPSPVAFCHRRLASVYPLYLVGLCVALALAWSRDKLGSIRSSALLAQVSTGLGFGVWSLRVGGRGFEFRV